MVVKWVIYIARFGHKHNWFLLSITQIVWEKHIVVPEGKLLIEDSSKDLF